MRKKIITALLVFISLKTVHASSILPRDLFIMEEDYKGTSTLFKFADPKVKVAFQLAPDSDAQKNILKTLQIEAVEKLIKALPDAASYYNWMTTYVEDGIEFCTSKEDLLGLSWLRWQNDAKRIPFLIEYIQNRMVDLFVAFYHRKMEARGILYHWKNLTEDQRTILWNSLKEIHLNAGALKETENYFVTLLRLR